MNDFESKIYIQIQKKKEIIYYMFNIQKIYLQDFVRLVDIFGCNLHLLTSDTQKAKQISF